MMNGLTWESGSIHYTEISNILQFYLADASEIVVNNEIKRKWIEGFGFHAINIELSNVTSPNSDNLCNNHDKKFKKVSCAKHNVKYMKKSYYLIKSGIEPMEWE